jgi:hypothetical protein
MSFHIYKLVQHLISSNITNSIDEFSAINYKLIWYKLLYQQPFFLSNKTLIASYEICDKYIMRFKACLDLTYFCVYQNNLCK